FKIIPAPMPIPTSIYTKSSRFLPRPKHRSDNAIARTLSSRMHGIANSCSSICCRGTFFHSVICPGRGKDSTTPVAGSIIPECPIPIPRIVFRESSSANRLFRNAALVYYLVYSSEGFIQDPLASLGETRFSGSEGGAVGAARAISERVIENLYRQAL